MTSLLSRTRTILNGIFEELAPDFLEIWDLYLDEIPLAFLFTPLHHSAAWELGVEPDPALVEGLQGKILEANSPDVLSLSDNAFVVPMGSPPCHTWLGPPPFVPPPTSVLGPHAGLVLIPKPEHVMPPVVGEKGRPLFPIYIPSGASSASEQDQAMDSSEGESDSSNAMDLVTSDDSPHVIPIGNLGLPKSGPFKSGPFKSGPFESVFSEPLSFVMPDDLETDETLNLHDRDRNIVPLSVYMSDLDPEDISDHSGCKGDYRVVEQKRAGNINTAGCRN